MKKHEEQRNFKFHEETISKSRFSSVSKTSSSPTSSSSNHIRRTKHPENSTNRHPFLLPSSRQRGFSRSSRFTVDIDQNCSKENDRGRFVSGGSVSMRYYPERSPLPWDKMSSSPDLNPDFISGRYSCDERPLRNHHQRCNSGDNFEEESSSDISSSKELGSAGSVESNSTVSSRVSSSRRLGKDVSSRYLLDVLKRSKSVNSDNSSHLSLQKSTMSSLKKSSWALSPGRSTLPSGSIANGEKRSFSFSNLKPPQEARITNHAKGKKAGVGKLFSLGMGLFKSKKSNNSSQPPLPPPPMPEVGESVRQLKLMHNRLVQWQFVNSKSEAAREKTMGKVESELILVTESLSQLRASVMKKKIQLDKEKLEMKLNCILQAQSTSLEAWIELENQHLVALSMMENKLHAAVCRVPIEDGAMVDLQCLSASLHHACYLTTSIKSNLNDFLDQVTELAQLVSELVVVISLERSLLEECFELFDSISKIEIEEWSMRCSAIQLEVHKQHELLSTYCRIR